MINKKIVSYAFLAALLANTAFAKCPQDDSGEVQFESIPTIVKDRIGDVSGFPVYYWEGTQSSGNWSTNSNGSNYIYDQNSALDLKTLGLCLENDNSTDDLTLYLRIAMNGFPGAYKDKSSEKSYLTGTGPLKDVATNPTDFSGSMVFKIADAAKISEGTYVYFMVASFVRFNGQFTFVADQDSGPGQFWLMKSKNKINSEKEFNSMRFTVENTEFVADLDEGKEDENGNNNQSLEGDPNYQGPDGGQPNEEQGDGEKGGEDFSEGVPTQFNVAARVIALQQYAGITKNSSVLVSAEMTTESPEIEDDELDEQDEQFEEDLDLQTSSVVNATSANGISDKMSTAKGKLKKLKKKLPIKKRRKGN